MIILSISIRFNNSKGYYSGVMILTGVENAQSDVDELNKQSTTSFILSKLELLY